MDSLSQLALGSAVGIAVMGRRTPVWKAALWGGVCGTLPDLDVLIDHGDPIRNMTFHRAESHSLFWLTLASPALSLGIASLHRELDRFRWWWLAVWLALVTHPLLDAMTIYGTQLFLPFTDRPVGVGSIFIIDPFYTLPLLVGIVAALIARNTRGWRWNAAGFALSTLYLAWSFGVQQHVMRIAQESLRAQGLEPTQVLVTPTAFNTVLWRVLAMTPHGYLEGFHSLLDADRDIRFDAFPRDMKLYARWRSDWNVARIAWFSDGFFKLHERDGELLVADLRMGQEPGYIFSFVVARRASPELVPVTPEQVGGRGDARKLLAWLWARLRGNELAPPR
jgi:inner membrane protein